MSNNILVKSTFSSLQTRVDKPYLIDHCIFFQSLHEPSWPAVHSDVGVVVLKFSTYARFFISKFFPKVQFPRIAFYLLRTGGYVWPSTLQLKSRTLTVLKTSLRQNVFCLNAGSLSKTLSAVSACFHGSCNQSPGTSTRGSWSMAHKNPL